MALTEKDLRELDEHKSKLGFTINKELAKALWAMRKAVMYGKRKRDGIFIIDGPEGSGKTVLGGQCMRFLQPEGFDLKKHIAWTPTQHLEQYDAGERFDALMYDEGVTGFHHLKFLSADSLQLQVHLNTCRSGQRFIVIIQPRFFEMVKMLALDRSRFLLHCYEYGEGGRESRFNFYNQNQKERLYTQIKLSRSGTRKRSAPISQLYMMNAGLKVANFPNFWPFDEAEYERLKTKTLRNYLTDDKDKFSSMANRYLIRLNNTRSNLKKPPYNLTDKEIARIFGADDFGKQLSDRTVQELPRMVAQKGGRVR